MPSDPFGDQRLCGSLGPSLVTWNDEAIYLRLYSAIHNGIDIMAMKRFIEFYIDFETAFKPVKELWIKFSNKTKSILTMALNIDKKLISDNQYQTTNENCYDLEMWLMDNRLWTCPQSK